MTNDTSIKLRMKTYPPIKAITVISVFASELYSHEIEANKIQWLKLKRETDDKSQ